MAGSERLGEYVNAHVQFAWQAWQAAIAAQNHTARHLGMVEPVRLTDDEIEAIWKSVNYTAPYAVFRLELARAIESAFLKANGIGGEK